MSVFTAAVNPRHDERFLRYQGQLLTKVNPRIQKGLEIGALDLPFITPDMGLVQYADYFETEALREIAAIAPGHSSLFVQPVDYVLSHTPLEKLPSDFEWIAAAHVIEHMPNLICWLQTIADRLVPNGLLFCVIPDGRYTFDLHRPLSSLGKILQDYIETRTVPAFASVFDAHYYSHTVLAHDIWGGKVTPDPHHHNSFDGAWSEAIRCLKTYVDCHVNVFTPVSFEEIISTLSNKNYITFTLEEVTDTEVNGLDFSAVLRKRNSVR